MIVRSPSPVWRLNTKLENWVNVNVQLLGTNSQNADACSNSHFIPIRAGDLPLPIIKFNFGSIYLFLVPPYCFTLCLILFWLLFNFQMLLTVISLMPFIIFLSTLNGLVDKRFSVNKLAMHKHRIRVSPCLNGLETSLKWIEMSDMIFSGTLSALFCRHLLYICTQAFLHRAPGWQRCNTHGGIWNSVPCSRALVLLADTFHCRMHRPFANFFFRRDRAEGWQLVQCHHTSLWFSALFKGTLIGSRQLVVSHRHQSLVNRCILRVALCGYEVCNPVLSTRPE